MTKQTIITTFPGIVRLPIVALLVLVAMFAFATTASADIIRGRVIDSETKEPLAEASVKLTQSYGDYGYSMMTTMADSAGVFHVFASGRCTLEVSMLGYYSKKKTVLAFTDSRNDTIDIGAIELKMSAQMLKMVEVMGHARRFTVRGDTIIFHPEAFHLQEGARLDELIRKLPGVEVDDEGRMSWNGKPIRLTMDGESMLGGEGLMKQLPAEAVQDIKAYNKASEFSERTGKDDGTQDMVLDLTIKPGFLDRWYGDVKAGYQTPKYSEGELSMNRLSKTDPMMVFADANNTNKRHRRYMDRSMGMWGSGFGQEQGGSGGWQHKWKEQSGTQELRSQYSFSGGVAHDDDWHTSRTETENFFPDTAASHITNENYGHNHELNPTFYADMHWAADTMNTFMLRASVEHNSKRSHSRTDTEQSESTIPGVPYVATLSQHIASHGEGRETKFNVSGGWEHYIENGQLGGSIKMNYTDGKNESWTDRTITSKETTLLTQSSTSPTHSLFLEAEIHRGHWFTKNILVQAHYSIQHNRNNSDCVFLTDGLADSANSYRDRHTTNTHHFELLSTINVAPLQIRPTLTTKWQRESQDYQRGVLDTAAVRRNLFVEPALFATWKLSKTIGFELSYSFRTSQPQIIQTIGYHDLTNPLFITEGNPDLKDTHIHDIKLTYNMVLARSQTSFSTSVSHQATDRDLVTALSYTPSTAVYTSRPVNVRGSRLWTFKLNIDQAFGDYFRLQNDFRLNMEQRYGYLTLLPTQIERTLNRQTNFHPRDKLTISFDKDWLKASVFGEINADRLRFTASPEQNTTLWDNNFGLEAEATVGNFVFSSTLTERTRRGYATQSMNKNRLIWDGSVTWKILKNKARIAFEFQDILNNEDGFWSNQSAYQSTSIWQDLRHHYVGINFTYHLDAKKKD
ncbi:MAG: outer membrane beta-barrel protein [Prevotella sp.]|nr:outer membrane beta-barrel protein [Prevotella sp.]